MAMLEETECDVVIFRPPSLSNVHRKSLIDLEPTLVIHVVSNNVDGHAPCSDCKFLQEYRTNRIDNSTNK